MAKCAACSREISRDAAFCPGCGEPFEKPGVSTAALVFCGIAWVIGFAMFFFLPSGRGPGAGLGAIGVAWLAAGRTSKRLPGKVIDVVSAQADKAICLVVMLIVLGAAGCGMSDPAPTPAALVTLDGGQMDAGGVCPLPPPTQFGQASFITPCVLGATDHRAICGVHVVATGAIVDQWWDCTLSVWTCVQVCQ